MTAPNPKIIDLLNNPTDEPWVSLEYFPPRSEEGKKNLYARMDRMRDALQPLFSDITWGAGGSTAELTIDIANHLHKHGHVANMHLTCTNMEKDGDPKKGVFDALKASFDIGVRNIVALRGDPAHGDEEWKATDGGFTCALDLVKYIREHYGDDFGISVAGYPEGHPNAITEVKEVETMSEAEKGRCSVVDGTTYVCKDADYEKEMLYLKEKVDAGSDFIITQMFYDTDVFLTFVNDCRAYGINCPVVPGIMCINNYNGFRKMTKFCKTRVTEDLDKKMESIKDDAAALKLFGVEFGIQMSKKILKSGVSPGLHYYTLNLEKVVYGIIDGLGIKKSLSLNSTKNLDSDEKDMVAVGSAWARVGDTVKSDHGTGIVKMIKNDGTAVVYTMRDNQNEVIELMKGTYVKVQ